MAKITEGYMPFHGYQKSSADLLTWRTWIYT